MSKIDGAIHEIHQMNQMAEEDQWMNRIHPLVKVLLTVIFIFITVSFHKYDLSGVLSMAIYPFILFVVGDISIGKAISRLRIVLPVVCVVGLFNPFFDKEIITYLGGIGISGGVISMLSLMVKGCLSVLAAYLLIATTTIEKICYALRMLHVPKMIVTQILLIYRYITVLLKEVNRVTQAYTLRAPGQNGVHFKAWGSLVGQMLLRSMDRADDVYASMCLRGYTGEFDYGMKKGISASSVLYFLVWTLVLILLRLFPLFKIVGGLFL